MYGESKLQTIIIFQNIFEASHKIYNYVICNVLKSPEKKHTSKVIYKSIVYNGDKH